MFSYSLSVHNFFTTKRRLQFVCEEHNTGAIIIKYIYIPFFFVNKIVKSEMERTENDKRDIYTNKYESIYQLL